MGALYKAPVHRALYIGLLYKAFLVFSAFSFCLFLLFLFPLTMHARRLACVQGIFAHDPCSSLFLVPGLLCCA